MKIQKYQRGGGNFWIKLARQLQSAPSNGETTIANQNANRQVLIDHARKEAIANGENPDRAEEEIINKSAKGTLEGIATGALATALIPEFTIYGLLGGTGRVAGGFAGSALGSKALGSAGDYADKKLNTSYLGDAGRLIGGFAGFGAGVKPGYKASLKFAESFPEISRKLGANKSKQFVRDYLYNLYNKGVTLSPVTNTVVPTRPPYTVTSNLLVKKPTIYLEQPPAPSVVYSLSEPIPYDKLKLNGEKLGLRINKYGEPVVPTDVSYDKSAVLQSKLIEAYQKAHGNEQVPIEELSFNPDAERQRWINYFRSPAYRGRVKKNSGLSEEEIDKFIEDQINNMQSAKVEYQTLPDIVKKDIRVYDPEEGGYVTRSILVRGNTKGLYDPDTHTIGIKDARSSEALPAKIHEDLHATLKRGSLAENVLKKSWLIDANYSHNDGENRWVWTNGLVQKEPDDIPSDFDRYVNSHDEPRVRGLKILRALDEQGLPLTKGNVEKEMFVTGDPDTFDFHRFTMESVLQYLNKLYGIVPLAGGVAVANKE